MPDRWRSTKRDAWPWLVALIACAASIVVVLAFRAAVHARDELRFRSAVQGSIELIERRLDAYVAVLGATRGFLVASEGEAALDRDRFHAFTEQLALPRRYPGIQGIGYTQRLARGEIAAVEAALRAQGEPTFRVWPQDDRAERHAIVALEPRDRRNAAALGFDMSTDPTRRAALDRARDTGEPAASGPVTLVQEIDDRKQVGFLLYVPVYQHGGPPATVEQRRAELRGFVYAAFRMDDLLAGIFGDQVDHRVSFTIFDAGTRPPRLMHRGPGLGEDPAFSAVVALDVAGRPWAVRLQSTAAFDASSSGWVLPYVVAAAVAGAALLVLLSWLQRRHARQLVEREQALRAAAEQASRTKDEFLGMLGHELRNPLAPIVTALELLGQRGPEHQREIDVIRRQVAHLHRLVDDLLDLSSLTSGQLTVEREPLELRAIVDEALVAAGPIIDAREVTVRVEVAPEGVVVEGDRARLVQVVANLTSNAAKYSHEGGAIAVHGERRGERVVLAVRDHGIGIAAEDLPRLFEPFVQIDRRVDAARGGLGIGLALARQLVALHGGSVVARSDGPGRGSELVVELPASDRRVEPAPAPAAAPRRVLVVDDNSDAADLMSEFLRGAGYDVATAYDPRGALDAVRTEPVDAAILDIGLPEMDGYELAARLGTLRLKIAVTGYGREEDRARSRAAGFAHHFVKPVSPSKILEVLATMR